MNIDEREFLRAPPHAVEAEQSVLGAMLLQNGSWDKIADLLGEEDFYRYDHRLIYQHMVRLINSNRPADVITVYESADSHGKAEEIGGLSYLNALAQNTPSAANIRHYAEIVRDRSLRRKAMAAAMEFLGEIEGTAIEPGALIDGFSTKLDSLSNTAIKSEPKRASESMVKLIEAIDNRYNGNEPLGIATGFVDIDRRLNGGMRPGNLIIVAARPKMGKSTLAQNIAQHVAQSGVSLILNLEMTEEELQQRNVAAIGGMNLEHVIDAKQMTDDDWPKLTHAVQRVNELELYLDCQPGMTIFDVRVKAKQVKRKTGRLDLLVIDYLQLMAGAGDNRNAQIEAITRGLKTLAKELDCPIILLSQLSRKVEERPNKRPMPSDLRDSGAIEQDCDIAIFLYRDEVYNPDTMDRGVCEANFALMRQGKPGITALTFIGEQAKFADIHRQWAPRPPKSAPSRARGFNDE